MFFSITNALIASKSVTEIATLVYAMAAFPAFPGAIKEYRKVGFEPFPCKSMFSSA
jgi:hypothetical protein